MKKKLIIVGASGHGQVVADIAVLNGYSDIAFLDDNASLSFCAGYHVLGATSMLENLDGDVVIAIGNANIREEMMNKYKIRNFPILAHPSAVIAKDVSIGSGTVIMAGTVINPNVTLGRGVIVNTSSSIDHDCNIGDFVHIAVGAHVSGTVRIGANTWVGTGAIVSNNVNICGGCMIGAGAVVIRDISIAGTYVGVPARMIMN